MSTYTVATGRWNDYSNNGALADSLTLDVRTAALLIAATATFVTIVGARFWSILSFSIFQIRASRHDRDGIHHQQQAIYRNSSQLGTLWMLMRIVWAWRGTARQNILRFVLFTLPPLVSFAAFTAAGIFSSRIAAPSYDANDVRIAPRNCGVISHYAPTDPRYSLSGASLYSRWSTNKARTATDYARRCYHDTTASLEGCQIYPKRQLPYRIETSAPCPFGGNRCYLGDNGAMRMTTNWLDSHRDLGINAPAKNRIRFQKVATCSVLKIDDLVSGTAVSGTAQYSYFLGLQGQSNSTFQWLDSSRLNAVGYSIFADKAMNGDPYQTRGWQPISDLNRTDADVSIFYLNSNGMRYTSQVYDPFFRAQSEVIPLVPVTIKIYEASNLTSVLACTDQFQIQNPNNNMATELTSANKAVAQALQICLNSLQTAALLRLGLTGYESLIFSGVDGLSGAALHASDIAYRSLSPGLPDNQWQIEVSGWFNASLARLQQDIIGWVSKDATELVGFADLLPPTGYPDYENMCQNQVVKNVGQYQTFSVTAIIIIFSVGLFIIVLSWVLEPVVVWCEKRLGRYGPGSRQWLGTSPLQLQRLSLRHDEHFGWKKCDSEIPVTDIGVKWPGSVSGDYGAVHVDEFAVERKT